VIRSLRRPAATLALALALAGRLLAAPQAPPAQAAGGGQSTSDQMADLVNALLGGLMGGGKVDGATLQRDVEEAGGIPFRRPVPVDFLNKEQLARYLRELLDEEYPQAQATGDERLLAGFDLLPPGTDLRALRARVLEDNVAGFYDDRPDRRRLYAVSEERSFTAMNQIVLAHELRHALQDQYANLNDAIDARIGDFDDRRLAAVSLFEGDATLLMERFVRLRMGAVPETAGDGEAGGLGSAALGAPGLFDVPGAPPVVRDQLMQPYLAGLALARAVWERGGASAMRSAWSRPPASTEQVLHPERFFAHEAPRVVRVTTAAPAGARVLSEGVLGEMLLRTLLGEGAEAAATGWGGDAWKLWDVKGHSALAWRSEWDDPRSAGAFHEALLRRFTRTRATPVVRDGWVRFSGDGGWTFALRRAADGVELVSSDDERVLAGLVAR